MNLILLGVSGGIAAYKAAELVRLLIRRGYEVHVVMTANATRFVAPLTFQALSGHPVGVDPWDPHSEWGMAHIDRAREADLFLIAPATADLLARLAAGVADDLLTTAALATDAPVWVSPSMNPKMLAHPATRANLHTLRERGLRVLESGVGEMACGDVGPGRLPEPEQIADAVDRHFSQGKDMAGLRVLVTAGPTREYLDPVRFLSNPSTGRMGFALAEAAAERGARVTLLTGVSALPTPPGVERVEIESAEDLGREMLARFPETDFVIASAAVSDYTPAERAPNKIKKKSDELVLRLKKVPDALAELGKRKKEGQVLVGFAAETEDTEANALKKLREKNLDLIVLNDILQPGAGFAVETNRVTLLDAKGGREELPLMPKRALADLILDRASASDRAVVAVSQK
ncbi:MAG: bifunctional phosphopantothenoylcysteine decarboxylase/phosphopantothenate--cysteine ligase CoaBC [Armatimonadetes bacterium]|nr:bifunctional phosphopantothenoylcysteine decarboxylase/phosphopantothenate--cysteine ligase CoaBC [Armatimonadota bacterium]